MSLRGVNEKQFSACLCYRQFIFTGFGWFFVIGSGFGVILVDLNINWLLEVVELACKQFLERIRSLFPQGSSSRLWLFPFFFYS